MTSLCLPLPVAWCYKQRERICLPWKDYIESILKIDICRRVFYFRFFYGKNYFIHCIYINLTKQAMKTIRRSNFLPVFVTFFVNTPPLLVLALWNIACNLPQYLGYLTLNNWNWSQIGPGFPEISAFNQTNKFFKIIILV